MNCFEKCPVIATYNETKQSLLHEIGKLDEFDLQVTVASRSNETTRYEMDGIPKDTPAAHNAMRKLFDAEFAQQEALVANAEARTLLHEAVEAQDTIINLLAETCITGCRYPGGQAVCTNTILNE